MVKDMFAFARHAKRVNVNQDDVKLLFSVAKIYYCKFKSLKRLKSENKRSKPTSSEATSLASSVKRVRNQFDDEEEDELFF